MKTTKITAAAALASMLLLLPLSAFADASDCQRLEAYKGDGKNESEYVYKLLKTKTPAQLRDAVDAANKCKANPSAESIKTMSTTTSTDSSVKTDNTASTEIAQRVLDAKKDIDKEIVDDKNATQDKLNDFNFAVGLGVLTLRNANDVIEQTVDKNVLRITNEEQYKLGLWLSTNAFLDDIELCLPFRSLCLRDAQSSDALASKGKHNPTKVRWGTFVATQLGGNSNSGILNSVAIGFSFMAAGSKRTDFKAAGTAPLVFQLGYGLTRIQTLADGYTNGMTLPTGTNQPVMKKSIGRGPVIIVSTAF